MLAVKSKRPSDILDYDVTFEDWITDDDTITTVTTSVTPADELVVDSVQLSSPDVKVWLSGGESGKTYDVDVTVSTTGGRVKEECFKVRVRDC